MAGVSDTFDQRIRSKLNFNPRQHIEMFVWITSLPTQIEFEIRKRNSLKYIT